MQAEASILMAILCVAIILTLSGCTSVPEGKVQQIIDDRWPRVQEACPSPVNIIIMSNGVPT